MVITLIRLQCDARAGRGFDFGFPFALAQDQADFEGGLRENRDYGPVLEGKAYFFAVAA